MPVHEARMLVAMRVRLANWIVRPMLVLMVFIVNMSVLMYHRLVHMFVFMSLGNMEKYAASH